MNKAEEVRTATQLATAATPMTNYRMNSATPEPMTTTARIVSIMAPPTHIPLATHQLAVDTLFK